MYLTPFLFFVIANAVKQSYVGVDCFVELAMTCLAAAKNIHPAAVWPRGETVRALGR